MSRPKSNPQVALRPPDLVVLLRLSLERGPAPTAYYQPVLVSAEKLALMRRIDELHLETPSAVSVLPNRLVV